MDSGEIASWQNIKDLFSSLNTARKKFSFSTVPESGGSVGSVYTNQPFSTMQTFIKDMKTNRFLKNVDISSLVVPTTGELIQAAFITYWTNVISTIQNICPNDTTNFSGYNGTNFSGHDGANFSGHDGANFSGHDGTNFSGVDGSNFSGVDGSNFAGVNGTNFAGVNGSNFAGVNGTNFSGVKWGCFSGELFSPFRAAEFIGHIGGFLDNFALF